MKKVKLLQSRLYGGGMGCPQWCQLFNGTCYLAKLAKSTFWRGWRVAGDKGGVLVMLFFLASGHQRLFLVTNRSYLIYWLVSFCHFKEIKIILVDFGRR